jgi:hypothetical protein
MILGCERIDASIDADVANKAIRTLDKVRYLINSAPAETARAIHHRCAPSLPSQHQLAFGNRTRKWPNLILAMARKSAAPRPGHETAVSSTGGGQRPVANLYESGTR